MIGKHARIILVLSFLLTSVAHHQGVATPNSNWNPNFEFEQAQQAFCDAMTDLAQSLQKARKMIANALNGDEQMSPKTQRALGNALESTLRLERRLTCCLEHLTHARLSSAVDMLDAFSQTLSELADRRDDLPERLQQTLKDVAESCTDCLQSAAQCDKEWILKETRDGYSALRTATTEVLSSALNPFDRQAYEHATQGILARQKQQLRHVPDAVYEETFERIDAVNDTLTALWWQFVATQHLLSPFAHAHECHLRQKAATELRDNVVEAMKALNGFIALKR